MSNYIKSKPPSELSKQWQIVWYRSIGRFDTHIQQKHIKNIHNWKIIDKFSAYDALNELYETKFLYINIKSEKLEEQFYKSFNKLNKLYL